MAEWEAAGFEYTVVGCGAAYYNSMDKGSKKRPPDPNELAKFVVGVATGEIDDTVSPKEAATRKAGKAGGLHVRRRLPQSDAQPQMSLLQNGKIGDFTIVRLVNMLSRVRVRVELEIAA